ncbi:MAG: glycosyltransferase, partial [Pseudomonadota bacterium]
LPSRWEGFGNVIVEALALNVPVIASDCPGGPAEILVNGRWGTLVAPDDAETLAEAIRGPLIGPPEARLSDRAADFGIMAVADQYLKALGIAPGSDVE